MATPPTVLELADLLSFQGWTSGDEPVNWQEILATSEAAVAGYLQVEALVERTVTEKRTPKRSRDTFVLEEGLLTSLTAVTIDAVDVTGEMVPDLWNVIRMGDPGDTFTFDVETIVTYKAGWTSATVPPNLRQAILTIWRAVFEQPGVGVESESIGDHSVRFSTGGEVGTVLTPNIRSMINYLLRPMGSDALF